MLHGKGVRFKFDYSRDISRYNPDTKEIKNRNEYFLTLDTDYKVNSEFQVYLGESSNLKQVLNNINSKDLPELFSEAYRYYYIINEKQADSINKLVEEVEKRC